MSSENALATVLGGATADPATLAAQRAQANEAARKADVAAIEKKGFSAYVKDLKDEKIKQMREDILASMGLSEEAMDKMSPEQRSAVETAISEEIQRRLNATASVEKQGKEAGTEGGGRAISALSGALAPGQDILRVLQEAVQTQPGESADSDGKKDIV